MASINQVNVLGTVYDIEDASAQQSITAIQGDIAEITTDLGNKAPLIEPTVGPSPVATFSDGAAGMPMEVTVALDPIQAGSGDPAPDNVRAISGHSGVDVTRTGKNLARIGSGNIVNGGYLIPCKAGDTFYAYLEYTEPNSSSVYGGVWNSQKNVSKNTGLVERMDTFRSGSVVSYSIRADGYFGIAYNTAIAGYSISKFIISKEPITSADDYEPYDGSVLTVTFPDPPGTVYGGTLTVKRDGTGKLVVDREVVTLSSTDGWNQISGGRKVFYRQASSVFSRFQAEGNIPVCDMYKGAESVIDNSAAANLDDLSICTRYPTTDRIYIRDNRFETVDEFKASFETINVVLKLATPITYDLTAEQVGQITSVKGLNNVWSAGQVEVTYAADTKAYVDGTVGSTETVYNADGYEWVQVSGVPNYGYACEIPLAGIPRQNVAVIATVTAATASDFSGFVAMLAPYYKVDVLAKKVTFYAAVPMYKITRVRAVYI